MAAVLATLTEVKRYLGVKSSSAQDFPDVSTFETYLQELMDNVEALLEAECGVTFASAASISNEPHDGTGTEVLYANYPVGTLTSVKIGIDATAPDETLTTIPDDIDSNGRQVLRRGGVWPAGRKNVYLTYTSADYKPEVAKQALYEGVAFLYRRRGKEHVSSTTLGELGSMEAASRFDFLPAWMRCKRALRVPVVV